MNDISGISSSQRLTSQPKVSIESAGQQPNVAPSTEAQEMEKLAAEMEQINHAFTLAQEIRQSLEAALQNLNPTK